MAENPYEAAAAEYNAADEAFKRAREDKDRADRAFQEACDRHTAAGLRLAEFEELPGVPRRDMQAEVDVRHRHRRDGRPR